eukprot:3844215-Karenia_brevis.AAC.1
MISKATPSSSQQFALLPLQRVDQVWPANLAKAMSSSSTWPSSSSYDEGEASSAESEDVQAMHEASHKTWQSQRHEQSIQ